MSYNRMVLLVLLVGLLAPWSKLLGVSGDLPERCMKPAYKGRCRGGHRRYYYNMETKTCTEFTYGGCGGNDNNFVELDECRRKCEQSA